MACSPDSRPQPSHAGSVRARDASGAFVQRTTTHAHPTAVVRLLCAWGASCVLSTIYWPSSVGYWYLTRVITYVVQALHPLFDVVPPSAAALQRQRRVLEAQRRLGIRNPNNPNNGPAGGGQGFRDQLLPGAGGVIAAGGGGGMLPPQMAAAPPSEDAIQQLTVRPLDHLSLCLCLYLTTTTDGVVAALRRLDSTARVPLQRCKRQATTLKPLPTGCSMGYRTRERETELGSPGQPTHQEKTHLTLMFTSSHSTFFLLLPIPDY